MEVLSHKPSGLLFVNFSLLNQHEKSSNKHLRLTLLRQLLLNHLDHLLHFHFMLLDFALHFHGSVPKCSLFMGLRVLDVDF